MEQEIKYLFDDLDYQPSPFSQEQVLKGIINLEVSLHFFCKQENTLYFSCGCECEKVPSFRKITGVHFSNSQERYYLEFTSYDNFLKELGDLAKELIIDYVKDDCIIC